MKSIDRRFDAIVIGSGAGGSIAVKELTERGMDVLLLEAGRDLTEADFAPPPPKPPRPLGMDLDLRAKAALAGQHVQARRTFFSETSNRFLVNDRENPYSTPRDAPYLWIRSRILGGRLNATAASSSGCRTSTFKPRAGTGTARTGRSPTPTSSPGTTGSRSSSASTATRTGSHTRRTASTSAPRSCPTSSRSSRRRSRSGGPIER